MTTTQTNRLIVVACVDCGDEREVDVEGSQAQRTAQVLWQAGYRRPGRHGHGWWCPACWRRFRRMLERTSLGPAAHPHCSCSTCEAEWAARLESAVRLDYRKAALIQQQRRRRARKAAHA